MSITRQEMFDRAVRGLASQGWKKAEDDNGNCLYQSQDGLRCAWGWVDPSLNANSSRGDVWVLRSHKIGLAGELSEEECMFARQIQVVHDASITFAGLKVDYVEFAKKHGLTWPSDVPV